MHKVYPMQELYTCIVVAPVAVPLAEEVRIRLCVRLRQAMERATDICLDIRDEPAALRESDAPPSKLSHSFWASLQKAESPTDIPFMHPLLSSTCQKSPEQSLAQRIDAGTLSIAASMGCCLVPFALASI